MQEISKAGLPGLKVNLRKQGIRGIRINQGDDDVSLRVKGPDLDQTTVSSAQASDAQP